MEKDLPETYKSSGKADISMHDNGKTTETPIECSFVHAHLAGLRKSIMMRIIPCKTCLKLTQDNKSNFSCQSSSEMWDSCLSILLKSLQSVLLPGTNLLSTWNLKTTSLWGSSEFLWRIFQCRFSWFFIFDLVYHLYNYQHICYFIMIVYQASNFQISKSRPGHTWWSGKHASHVLFLLLHRVLLTARTPTRFYLKKLGRYP